MFNKLPRNRVTSILVSTLLCFIISSYAMDSAQTKSAWDLFDDAQKARHDETQSLQNVRSMFLEVVAKTSDNFLKGRAYLAVAKTYFASDHAEVIRYGELAIKHAPKFVDCYFTMADFYAFSVKNSTKALQLFDTGMQFCTHKQELKKGWYYQSTGKIYRDVVKSFTQAEKQYQDGFRKCGGKKAAFARLLGDLHKDAGNHKQAHAYFLQAKENIAQADFNESLDIYRGLAQSFECIGEVEKAHAMFIEGMSYLHKRYENEKIRTNIPDYYCSYAEFLKVYIDTDKAVEILLEGIEISQTIYAYNTASLHMSYAEMLFDRGDAKAAKKHYKMGLEHARKRSNSYAISILIALADLYKASKPEKRNQCVSEVIDLVKAHEPSRLEEIMLQLSGE